MRTSGMAVAVIVTGFACFSTARYDTAHVKRVVDINARYDAESRRQQDWIASNIAALDRLKASVIAIAPGSSSTPIHRVDERDDIVACRSECTGAPCMREICQPAYADALVKTYASADLTWVTHQLSASTDADLEALLAFSHNQAVLRAIDAQVSSLAQLQDQARRRLEQEREREIRASIQQRDAEIVSGRAARRARVKAAADAFAATDRTVPVGHMTYAPSVEPRARGRAPCTDDASCSIAR